MRCRSPISRYQGVVNALVVSRARLERFYWTAVMDRRFPFQGVVETTHVIPPEWVGGRHLTYLMNYCDAESEPYRRSDDVVAGQAVEGLATLYPRFRRQDVEAVYVFRAPHVEPAWTLGYLDRRPVPRVGRSRALSVHDCPGVSPCNCLEYERGAGGRDHHGRARRSRPVRRGGRLTRPPPWSRLARGEQER